MPKYNVNFSMPVHFRVAVDAEDDASAIDAAMEFAYLSGYAGNFGTDKLVGTSEECVSLEPGEGVIEGEGWEITVEEA